MPTNIKVFRNAKANDEEVFILAETRVWVWITNKYSTTIFSYSDWCFMSKITSLLIL